ncbi:hypothetical protein VNO77_15632 [Canavalia gladiata]|uniref:Uncharacterized protein n=1 Tax=Canavalia gladiata TaxID=3824 RepID=A0AAN9M4I9_CANGL
MCDQVQNSPTLLHPMHTHFQPKRTPPPLETEAHTSSKRSLTIGEQMLTRVTHDHVTRLGDLPQLQTHATSFPCAITRSIGKAIRVGE